MSILRNRLSTSRKAKKLPTSRSTSILKGTPMRPPAPPASAFSLIEILVSIGIAAVLVALLMSGIQGMAISNRQAGCISNLRSLNIAAHAYANDHNHCFAIGYGSMNGGPISSWNSWMQSYIQSRPSYKTNESGITFCPATKTGASGIYARNATTWLTDYNVNRFVFSDTETNNRRSKIPGSRIMIFDGQGGVAGSAATANQRLRHRGRFNVIFVDGSVETLTSFTGYEQRWQAD